MQDGHRTLLQVAGKLPYLQTVAGTPLHDDLKFLSMVQITFLSQE